MIVSSNLRRSLNSVCGGAERHESPHLNLRSTFLSPVFLFTSHSLSSPSPSTSTMTATLSDPPIRTSLLLSLTTQGALLNELFSALPSASSDIPTLHASLVQSSAQLDALARDAEAHQRAWEKLLAQKREVEALERKVRNLIRELEGGRIELESMVDEGRRVSQGIEKSESGRLPAIWCKIPSDLRPSRRPSVIGPRARPCPHYQRAGVEPPGPR